MTGWTFAALTLAVLSIFACGSCLILVHCQCRTLAALGRRLFIASLLTLGAVGLLAAFAYHESLAPLGLVAGLLIAAMLCELPAPQGEQTST